MTLQLVSSLPARCSRLAVPHLRRSCKLSPRVSMSSSSFSSSPDDQSQETEAPHAPVTRERRLNPDLQQQLPKPCLRAIGCGLPVSVVGSLLINLVLSYPTQPGWLPSPLLSIHIKNIHKGKHGSDSEAYDTEGRFDPSKFDAIFSKYGRTHPNALTKDELNSMLEGNRNMYDFLGWAAAAGEWLLLYSVAKDKDGLLQREAVRGAFDGSLFERLQDNKKSS
ncbi:peroxygenase isoform X3 [Setaria viridis]|uniref:peroxygenase isoform X3 n=1 Tax=Setaria viridis TaxID=4556 RepID=UPI001493A7AC|nr:peroxygenase-like isoform X3 [Setaria viridis]